MTATNVYIKDLIYILSKISEDGTQMVDLDIIPDENHPTMNKIIVHPVNLKKNTHLPTTPSKKIVIRNPNFSTDNNDIFESFNDLV